MIDIRRRLLATDRVMVLAPHPDDESIATGGLLQAAILAGAEIRVTYLTDGENNPWAQRATERRWRIGPSDRARWGTRRRREALDALECLGVRSTDATFLGLPDQRVTEALLDPQGLGVRRLAEEILSWRPTQLFVPSLGDLHPDHSATALMAQLATAEVPRDGRPQLFSYLVHGPAVGGERSPDAECRLTSAERETKQRAILRHASQLSLRRRFLLHFADRLEGFECGSRPWTVNLPGHPLRLLRARGDEWSFAIRRAVTFGFDAPSLLLISQGHGETNVLRVPVSRFASCRPLNGAAGAAMAGRVTVCPSGSWLNVTIESPAVRHADIRLAKLDFPLWRKTRLFDRWPWVAFGFAGAPLARPKESRAADFSEPLEAAVRT